MRKRYYRFIFFVLLLLTALFPVDIALKIIELKVNHELKDRFGFSLVFERIYWSLGSIHFINGMDDALCFSKAQFTPHFNLFKKELGGVLHISNLSIKHENQNALKNFESRKKRSRSFFNPYFVCEINEGSLLFDQESTCIHFDLQGQILGEKNVGRMMLMWEEKPLETFFSYANGELEVSTHFSDHSCFNIYQMIHHFIGDKLGSWEVKDGEIDGRITAHFDHGQCHRCEGRLHLRDTHAKNEELTLRTCLDAFDATFDYNSEYDDKWNGDFELSGGNLALEQECWGGLWDIDSLNSRICVKRGQVESSFLRGRLMGMEGEIDLDWESPKRLMHLAFNGYSNDIVSMIPDRFSQRFLQAFPDDLFELDAIISRCSTGLELEGSLFCEEQKLSFGAQFGGKREIPSPPQGDFVDRLKEQFCLSEKRLGWFETKQLCLEKFLDPFLFDDNSSLGLTGTIDLEGSFDENYVVLFYDGKKIALESPKFRFTTDVVAQEQEMLAVHYIDLNNWQHVGYLPLKGASHLQKKNEFQLDDILGVVHFDNNTVRINDIVANWQGLLISGKVQVDVNSTDNIDTVIDASIEQGSIISGSHLISHFIDSSWVSYPFTGTFSANKLFFKFNNGILLDGELEGISNFELAPFYESQTQFCYNYKERNLTFSDSKGVMLLNHHPYAFSAPTLRFLPEKLELKLAVYNEEKELIDVNASFDKVKNEISILADKLIVQAVGEGSCYQFSQIAFGEYNASCTVIQDGDLFAIESLNLSHQDHTNLLFSGIFDWKQKRLKGSIDATDFELDALPFRAKGRLLGHGEIDLSQTDYYSNFTLSSQDLELYELPFADVNEIHCIASSDYGIVVEGLELKDLFALGELHYKPATKTLCCDECEFSLPSSKLHLVTQHFPEKIDPSIIEKLKEDSLDGELAFEWSPENFDIKLALCDGLYSIFDKSYYLKDLHIEYTPRSLHIAAKHFFREKEYKLHLRSGSVAMHSATLSVVDEDDLLTTFWSKDAAAGWLIDKVEGSCAGVVAELYREEEQSDFFKLGGQVHINPAHLPVSLKQLGFGGDYLLDGDFTFEKNDLKKVTFSGELKGEDCLFHTVELASLTAACQFSNSSLNFDNLTIEDWSGRLLIDHAHLDLQGAYPFFVSQLQVQDFRLSRLTSEWTRRSRGDRPIFRSIFVPLFEVNDLRGNLFDKKSYVGSGSLRFTNFPKRTLFNNLLMIPAEITARIGLDFTCFIPARGTIVYTIEDGKITILDFDEIYSDGKHSRFYLAENTTSTIDLDGTMDLNIRMKHYNLLMKLAELFTVSVRGTVRHPTYELTSSDPS